MKTFALQGDTLDAICVRYYGRTEGVVEAVLAANPGLAELGAVLPHGTGYGQREHSLEKLVTVWRTAGGVPA